MRTSVLCFAIMLISFIANANPALKTLSLSSKGDQMAYDKTTLSAKPNQPIKLTFKNGSAKTAGLQHNFVLVKSGTADTVAQACIVAGADKGWLAETPDVLAHTKLLNAGESETITFTAPGTSGDYPYFCSFPGHNAMMKGILQVK